MSGHMRRICNLPGRLVKLVDITRTGYTVNYIRRDVVEHVMTLNILGQKVFLRSIAEHGYELPKIKVTLDHNASLHDVSYHQFMTEFLKTIHYDVDEMIHAVDENTFNSWVSEDKRRLHVTINYHPVQYHNESSGCVKSV